MKPPNRKLGEPFAPRLILKPNGTLAMADGSSVQDYLRRVRRKWRVRGDVQVTINILASQLIVEKDALLARGWGA